MIKDPSKNIPNVNSPAEAWIQWHRDLLRVFGKKQANSIWVYAWSKRGSKSSSANTKSLRDYMSNQGVDISKTTLDAVGDSVLNFGSGMFSFFKWNLIIGGTLLGIIVIAIGYNVVKNPEQSARLASNIFPQGRGLKASKKLLK